MSGPYDASAFCRIQELYERAAVITHAQWDWDADSRQHFNHTTNEPTQISDQEQVHFNRLGVSAAGFLNLMRSHFDSDAVQDETILGAFSDIAGDDAVVKEDAFHIIMDHLRDDYEGLFQRLYARPSRRSPVRIRKVPSLARLHYAHSDESVDVDSSLHSAGSLSDDRHSRIWHDWKADQKADTVAKPASIRTSDTCEERAPIEGSVLAAWQMFYCGGSAPGVHAQKCSHKSEAARESAQGCYVV